MTYIDEETYNWKELKGEDEIIMRGYNYCIEDIKTACDNIIDEIQSDFDDSETFSRIALEICEKFTEELDTWIEIQRTELTCSLMENSDNYSDDE